MFKWLLRRSVDSKVVARDSTSALDQLGKTRLQELSNGFKTMSLKTCANGGTKDEATSPYLMHSMSLGAWKSGPPASGATAAGQLQGNDRGYLLDAAAGLQTKEKDRWYRDNSDALKFRAFKPGSPVDGDDNDKDEGKRMYTFKSQGKSLWGDVSSNGTAPTFQLTAADGQPYWSTNSDAPNSFTSPYGGLLGEHQPGGSPTILSSQVDESGTTTEQGSETLLGKPANLDMPFKFTQGASFGAKDASRQAVSRHNSLPASRPAPPRVPRLNLPQTGVPVKPELSRLSTSYVPSSDESVDTIITESSARSTASYRSVEQPKRGATMNSYCRPVKEPTYPWGDGGVEPYRPGATWTEGQTQSSLTKDPCYTLKRSGSSDSRRSDQSRKSYPWGTTTSEVCFVLEELGVESAAYLLTQDCSVSTALGLCVNFWCLTADVS